jgi:hypothetical protein
MANGYGRNPTHEYPLPSLQGHFELPALRDAGSALKL